MGAPLRPMVVVSLLVAAAAVASVGVTPRGAAGQAPCMINVGTTPVPYGACLALPGPLNMTVGWSIVNGSTLRAAHVSNSVGWAGLAFSGAGNQMVAAAPPPVRAVVGFTPAGAPGIASAAVYELTGRSSAAVVALTPAAAAAAGYTNVVAARNADGTLAVAFDRALDAPPAVGAGPTNVLWAVGPPPQTGTVLQQHNGRVAGSVTFVAAGGGGTPAPGASPTTAPPVPGPAPGASPTGEADASPDVTASPESDDAVCFPADATVDVVGRGRVAMADLRVGDVVAVGGGHPPSAVYAFSHADAAAESTFVSLTTRARSAAAAGGGASASAAAPAATPAAAPLRLSPGHYLPVNGRLAAAKTVVVGDTLSAGAAGTPVTVTAVARVAGRGLYAPHTADGAVLVDGIRASCYTMAVEPRVAAALLAPARWAVSLAGASAGRAVGRAVEWGRSAVAALPSGRDVL